MGEQSEASMLPSSRTQEQPGYEAGHVGTAKSDRVHIRCAFVGWNREEC